MLLVFGSINVDLTFRLPHLPAVGETVLTTSVTQAIGGKGANQAMAAARDGASTCFIGCVGSDGYGETARQALAGLGIDVGGLTAVPGSTGLAAVWIDANGGNQIAVASGANAALKAEALRHHRLSPETTLVLQLETPVAEVEAAIVHAKPKGAKIILNLAPAQPVSATALSLVDVLVVNEHAAAHLAASLCLRPGPPAERVAALAGAIGNTVIITLGGEGAIAAEGDRRWRAAALPVRAIDTTGAGDCFVGVLAAALMRGESLPAAMRRAAVAGSLACTVVGAMPSFPTRHSIDAALAANQLPIAEA